LVADGVAGGFTKPEYAEEEVVPLRFGLGKKSNGVKSAVVAAPPPAVAVAAPAPVGVGFVDFSDDLDLDLDAEDDDDVIDEDTLLTEEDLRRPIQQPPECLPQPGKKRRACKDWYVSPPDPPHYQTTATANNPPAHAAWQRGWRPRTRRAAPRQTRT
jgi:hypothetical protein